MSSERDEQLRRFIENAAGVDLGGNEGQKVAPQGERGKLRE